MGRKGSHWYYNGKEYIMGFTCPPGYWREAPSYENKSCTGQKWYTNGVEDILRWSPVEGYWRGRSKTKRDKVNGRFIKNA